jgi:hypothetical protein
MDQQHHEMVLGKTHPSGVDEWYCPTCGRRLVMEYEPAFKKTVLTAGDETAIHSGGKGGIRIGSMQAVSTDPDLSENEPIIPADDPSLAPWVAWLDNADFEKLWNDQN